VLGAGEVFVRKMPFSYRKLEECRTKHLHFLENMLYLQRLLLFVSVFLALFYIKKRGEIRKE